jgi:hypothetical protein
VDLDKRSEGAEKIPELSFPKAGEGRYSGCGLTVCGCGGVRLVSSEAT